MNKKSYVKYYLAFILFQGLFIWFPQISRSQTPSWAWAKDVHTITQEFATDVAVDTLSGDIVTVGTYTGSFLGTPFGSSSLSTVGGGFVAKFDPNGNVLWAFSIGNNADDGCNSVAISGAGNIYVTGYFQSAAEFKGTSLISNIVSANNPVNKEMFLAKYNSAGQLQWVAQGGGSQDDEGYGVALNGSRIFVTGYFINTGNFYSASGFSGIPSGSNSPNENMFIACYDANGVIQWESDAGSGQSCFGRDVTADNNAVYVIGDFKNASLDMYDNVGGYAGSVLNSAGSKEDAFVMSLTLGGAFNWGQGIHSNNSDFGRGICQSGLNMFVTGSTSASANFPGYSSNPVATSASGLDLFVAQLSKTTGLTNWVISEPGSNDEEGISIATDTSNTICLTGYFQSTINFSGGTTIISTGGQDILVANYNSSGSNVNWVMQAGANGTDIPHGISTNNTGDIYVAGEYDKAAVFGAYTLTADSPPNIFVAKIGCTQVSNNTISAAQTICANQTPATLTGSSPSGGAPPFTYLWQQSPDGSAWVSASGTNNTATYSPPSLTTTTYYRRIITSGGNCPGSITSSAIIITVNPLPTVTANATATVVCAGNSVTLTGGGASTYTWSGGVSNGVSFIPSSTQTYTVTGTDVNGCTNTATKTITVNSLPTVTAIATSTVVCAGSSVTLTGAGANTYTWTNGVSNGVAFNPTSTQTYTVTGTDLNGCTDTDTKTIAVNTPPTVTANASATVVCAGSTVTLTGGGASTYTWSNGVSDGVAFVPPSTQTYTVTGTDVNGCTNTATKTITVNPLPTVTVTASSDQVCSGNTVTLSGAGANTYTWSGSISDGIPFAPSSSQTYTVTGTDVNGCTNSATKTITVNPFPTVTANATSTVVCSGSSVTLTGGGANTYTWSGGVSNGVAFNPTSTQTYTVTGTDVNGCTNTATKTITVDPLPTVTANATSTVVCAGNSVTLTGGGANTYTWSGGISNGTAFVPASTQTYTVTGTDANGCINTAVKTITVNPLPTVTANASSTTVCAGSSVTLTGGGANTYTWSGGVANGIAFVPASSQTYTVTGTDVNGCANSATKTITVNPLPNVTANATATVVCNGNNVTLTGGGANTYTWSGGVSNGVAFAPSSTQTYTVTGTDVNGCTNSATKIITVNPLPSVTANASSNSICMGGTATLTGGGAITYAWSSGVSNGIAFNPTSTQTYTVTGTDANGCINSAVQTITVNPLPTVTANATTTLVCAGNSVTLTGGGANTYTWSSGVSDGVPFTVSSSQTFTVTGTNANGCINSATKTITADQQPTVSNAGLDQNLCISSTATLSANVPTTGTGMWSVMSGSGVITTVSSPGSGVTGLTTGQTIFIWTISNGICPASTSTVSVTVDTIPTNANAGPDVTIYSPSTNFSANMPLIGNGTWSMISGAGNISNSVDPASLVTDLQFGQNVFHWTISNGSCPASVDEVIITVHELVIPNGFSPNADGTNDYFEIPGLTEYSKVKLDVFNRWGNLVFQSTDYKNDWAGKNSAGEDLTDDTYYYTLEIPGKKTYKGFVILKRK